MQVKLQDIADCYIEVAVAELDSAKYILTYLAEVPSRKVWYLLQLGPVQQNML